MRSFRTAIKCSKKRRFALAFDVVSLLWCTSIDSDCTFVPPTDGTNVEIYVGICSIASQVGIVATVVLGLHLGEGWWNNNVQHFEVRALKLWSRVGKGCFMRVGSDQKCIQTHFEYTRSGLHNFSFLFANIHKYIYRTSVFLLGYSLLLKTQF